VESTVVSDLIRRFPCVFEVSEEELERELRILTVLETYHNSSNNTPAVKKPSGDLKLWVYLHSESAESVAVKVWESLITFVSVWFNLPYIILPP